MAVVDQKAEHPTANAANYQAPPETTCKSHIRCDACRYRPVSDYIKTEANHNRTDQSYQQSCCQWKIAAMRSASLLSHILIPEKIANFAEIITPAQRRN